MNHVQYLLQELKVWTEEGLLDDETSSKIASRYAQEQNRSSSWSRIILGSLGALLIGLGVIALLAANWDVLSRPNRTMIAFLPLTACVLAYAIAWKKAWTSRGFFEPLGIFWSISIGAGISLIAQTYNISGDPESFVLSWTLLLLPILYATQAVVPCVGYFAGLLSWACMSQYSNGITVLYWPFALLALPALLAIRSGAPGSIRLGLIVWGAALCSTAALGVSLEKTLPGLWMIIYAGAFAALLLAGTAYEPSEAPILQTPLRTLGGCGLAVVLYLLIYDWPWKEVGWDHYHASSEYNPLFAYFDYALACLLPILAGFLLLVANRKSPITLQNGIRGIPLHVPWGIAPVIVAAAYIIASRNNELFIPALTMMIYLGGLGLATLAQGLLNRSMRLVNAGVLIAIAIILGKFFSSDIGFTVKGIAFICSGICFFLVNMFVGRYLKREEDV